MTTKQRPQVSFNELRRIIREEAATLGEAIDHKSINDIVGVASKLLAAVEAFKEKAPPAAINALTPHLGHVEKALEGMVENPGSYIARPRHEPKRVSLRKAPGEGSGKETA